MNQLTQLGRTIVVDDVDDYAPLSDFPILQHNQKPINLGKLHCYTVTTSASLGCDSPSAVICIYI